MQQFLHKRDFGIVIMHNLCNKKSYLSGAIYCKITFYAFLCTSFFSSCTHSWWLLYGYFYKWHSQTHISLPHPALPIFFVAKYRNDIFVKRSLHCTIFLSICSFSYKGVCEVILKLSNSDIIVKKVPMEMESYISLGRTVIARNM